MNFKTAIFATLATTAAIALTGAASATTIINGGSLAAGDDGLASINLAPGSAATYVYTASESLRVLDFISVASTANNMADLLEVSFGYNSFSSGRFAASYTASEIIVNGATAAATSSIPGFLLAAGQSFTLFFDYDTLGSSATGNSFRFNTEAVATVPLPAGILLLSTALGGLGLARRRRTKAA